MYSPSYVYLIHFEQPVTSDRPARHYIGFARRHDLEKRLAAHAAGSGARITQVAVERGIGLVAAQLWHGDRRYERRLKNQKNAPRLCPICNPPRVSRALAALDDISRCNEQPTLPFMEEAPGATRPRLVHDGTRPDDGIPY